MIQDRAITRFITTYPSGNIGAAVQFTRHEVASTDTVYIVAILPFEV